MGRDENVGCTSPGPAPACGPDDRRACDPRGRRELSKHLYTRRRVGPGARAGVGREGVWFYPPTMRTHGPSSLQGTLAGLVLCAGCGARTAPYEPTVADVDGSVPPSGTWQVAAGQHVGKAS